MSCEQMAAASHGSVTVEACKQMMGAQQAMEAAASDPKAVRPGDDKMIGDVTKQLSANPRLARLFQLANQKRCKMGN